MHIPRTLENPIYPYYRANNRYQRLYQPTDIEYLIGERFKLRMCR